MKHGASNSGGPATPEYAAWLNMRNRCNNPNYEHFADYGGRGITVCAQWDDFRVFLADVGLRPSSELTLDRIKTDGDYEPDNVRWATREMQAQNRRWCVLSKALATEIREMFAYGMTKRELDRRYGISRPLLNQVLAWRIWK